MRKRTRWLLSGLAVGCGATGVLTALLGRKKVQVHKRVGDVWARPGMPVTFRAELMPGRDRLERTYRVKELFSSGRVSLHDVTGEHAEKEFEPIQFDKPSM
jgi:hypothetical protein